MTDHVFEFDKDPDRFMRRLEGESKLHFCDWPGMCTTIAFHAAQCIGSAHADTAYGLYSGQVLHRYTGYTGQPVYRHGWVVLRDGRILDPTRWCFTGGAPTLAVLDGDDSDYDEGAPSVRQSGTSPKWETDVERHTFHEEDEALGALCLRLIPGACRPRNEGQTWPVAVTKRQFFWLCNLHPEEMGRAGAFALYRWLYKRRLVPLMPVDYQTIIRRWVRWG